MATGVIGMVAGAAQNSAIASAGRSSIGNEAGYWTGELTGSNERRRKQQLEQQKKLNAMQEASNIRQADYTQGLNKDYFDYTADYNKASNQVSRLKEAGLNPALMYGMQGAIGSTGASGGGKAEGVSGAHASNESERLMAETAQQGMGLQAMRTQAEIKVMESQAKKNEADANRTAGSQTELDYANIENIYHDTEIKKELAWIEKINADFAYEYKRVQTDLLIGQKNVTIEQKDNIKKSTELLAENMRMIDKQIDKIVAETDLTRTQEEQVRQTIAESIARISLMSEQEKKVIAKTDNQGMQNQLLSEVMGTFSGDVLKALPLITSLLKMLITKGL